MTSPEFGHHLLSACVDSTRVLVLRHFHDDTYLVYEEGEVSLADGATLKTLLSQLSEGS